MSHASAAPCRSMLDSTNFRTLAHRPIRARGIAENMRQGLMLCPDPSRMMQRRCRKASRNAGIIASVSARALIILEPAFRSFAQCGSKDRAHLRHAQRGRGISIALESGGRWPWEGRSVMPGGSLVAQNDAQQ